MASETKGRRRPALADCTNTPSSVGRPRRSCGAYEKDHDRANQSPFSSKASQEHHRGKRKRKNYEIHGDCNELQAQPPSSSDNFSIVAGDRARDLGAEKLLIEKQSLDTPQAASQDAGGVRTPEGNDESDSQGFRVYSKRRQSGGRSAENLSLSCPPLGRVTIGSVAMERSREYIYHGVKICKRFSTEASADLPESGRKSTDASTRLPESGEPKCQKKVRRRRNSMPEHGGQHSLPEDYIREQQAHFAEVDAFELQEEDASDST